MRAACIILVQFILVTMWVTTLGFGFVGALEIIDPHTEPAKCSSCHNQDMTAKGAGSSNDMLLGDSIDETCHICHPYDCCRINSLKGHNHVSSIGKWDVDKFTEPESLPLFDGKMTCLTCHFHRMTDIQGPNYRMIRLVEIRLDRIDWTRLCLDCHVSY